MSSELPALADVAAAALAVGLLFCARFALALRRLRSEAGDTGGSARNLWNVREAGRFGADREPERRHALRQGIMGLAFLAAALLVYGWLLFAPSGALS